MYYDQPRLEAMRALYEQGKSLREVGETFYLSAPAVWYIFNRYGIPRRKTSAQIGCRNPERLEQMRAMHKDGHTLREIADHFNVTPADISLTFKKYNIKTERRPRRGDS